MNLFLMLLTWILTPDMMQPHNLLLLCFTLNYQNLVLKILQPPKTAFIYSDQFLYSPFFCVDANFHLVPFYHFIFSKINFYSKIFWGFLWKVLLALIRIAIDFLSSCLSDKKYLYFAFDIWIYFFLENFSTWHFLML